jgi:hypothetical protein
MGGVYIGGGIGHAQKIRWEILKGRDNVEQLGAEWKIIIKLHLKSRAYGNGLNSTNSWYGNTAGTCE